MDYIITNQAELLRALLEILGRHHDEPHVGEAFAYLKDARFNYQQRSIDHMVRCLVLAIDELLAGKLSEGLLTELRSEIHQFVSDTLKAGRRSGSSRASMKPVAASF